MTYKDSEGTEIINGDRLLSCRSICPVQYIFHLGPKGPFVSYVDTFMPGTLDFEYFKTLRPKFIKA